MSEEIIEAEIVERKQITGEVFIMPDYDFSFSTPEKEGQLDMGFFDPWTDNPNEPQLVVQWDGSRIDEPDSKEEKPDEAMANKELPVYEITMENYSERMPMGIFKMEAGLMSGAGFTYKQMQDYRVVAEVLNKYLTDTEKVKDLTPDQKM